MGTLMDRLWEQRRESWAIEHHPGVSAVHAPSKSLHGSTGPASARPQGLISLSPCLALLWIPCPRSVPNSVISSFPAQLLVSPRGLPHHLRVWLRAAWSCQYSVSICLPTGWRVLRRKGPRWHCALLSPGPHTATVQSHSQCSGPCGRGWLAGGPEEARQGQCARARVLRLGHGCPLGEVPAARVACCLRSACVHTPL